MMRRQLATVLLAGLCLALAPAPASAEFGLSEFDVTFTAPDGSPATQAGSHPHAMETSFLVNSVEKSPGVFRVDGQVKDIDFLQAPGFVGDPFATPTCTKLQFLESDSEAQDPACTDATVVGINHVTVLGGHGIPGFSFNPIYNLQPPPGVAMRLGFWVTNVPVIVDNFLRTEPPYNVIAKLANTSQMAEVLSSEFTLWGVPADPAHDKERGTCISQLGGSHFTGESCPANVPPKPFITLPRRCEGPLRTDFEALSWWSGDPTAPGPPATDTGFALTHDNAEPPSPLGTTGCEKLGFAPRFEARASSDQAASPSGLEVELSVADEGLANPAGIAHSDLKKAEVTLPEGFTANPSLAEGLKACSESELEREKLSFSSSQGCPEASKVGSVEVETPLLEGELLRGSLYIAEPYRNRFGSLLALFMVIRHPEKGILLKLAGEIEPDPETGQIATTFADLPQTPFSEFRLRLREGGRSPLITPERCGEHEAVAKLTPTADPSRPLIATAELQVGAGPGGGPCPPGGTPPFAPGFAAGSLNNAAGAYSPFYMRLTRQDGEQDITRFAATLPPGVVGKLAGVPYCPEAQIAAARGREGKAELASPSCPPASAIGRAVGGAGAGSQLTYVPGAVYLAGPYNGAPISVVAIVPAVAGPFDVGNVVVRQALRIDPLTAEVRVDGAASDVIPHILAGIPLKVRDIRVHVDRPGFTLNPTSCEEAATAATLFGSSNDVFDPADDLPVALASRYQAAGCASLPFRPRLGLALRGGTRRGAHPALRGVFRPRPGHANLKRMVLRLPTSAFLDQGHIRTICTRVQFAQDACPKGAVYGRARAFTPLLDQPLEGPVYLRSSNNNLPDFVAALKGIVDVEAVARIDSARGGIRATFTTVPDAPLTKVVVNMQGGKKGLIVNSRHLCRKPGRNRANARMLGHNAKRAAIKPVVRALGCKKRRGGKRPGRGRGGRAGR